MNEFISHIITERGTGFDFLIEQSLYFKIFGTLDFWTKLILQPLLQKDLEFSVHKFQKKKSVKT